MLLTTRHRVNLHYDLFESDLTCLYTLFTLSKIQVLADAKICISIFNFWLLLKKEIEFGEFYSFTPFLSTFNIGFFFSKKPHTFNLIRVGNTVKLFWRQTETTLLLNSELPN